MSRRKVTGLACHQGRAIHPNRSQQFDTCKASIRTGPVLQHDENRIEDVDTDSEDHAADEIRYGCMSRPYMRPKPTKQRPIEDQPTFDERFKRHQRNKERLDEALI